MQKNRLFLLLIICLFFLAGCKTAVKKEDAAISVRVVKIEEKDVPVKVLAPGRVSEHEQVKIVPQVTGKLKKVFFKRGQHVHKGDLLALVDQEPFVLNVKQAQAQLDKMKVQAKLSHDEYKRYISLYEAGGISQNALAQYHTTKNENESEVVAAEANLEIAKTNLGYCEIGSPIDGKIGDVLINTGNIINANTSVIAVVNRVRPIDVYFSVPDKYLEEIRNAFKVKEVLVSVFDEKGNKAAQGKLDFIDNEVSKTAGTIALKAIFANDDNRLFPGAFLNVQLELSVQKNALVVPSAAVLNNDEGAILFVVDEENTVHLKKVKTEQAFQDSLMVVGDIKKGETIVVEGQLNLKEGSKVSVKS